MAATITTLPGGSTVGGYGNGPHDPNGTTQVASGGQSSAVNITAAQVIKATPGRLAKVAILGVVGTGGNLTINDCATVAAATTANQIANIPGNTTVGGAPISFDWPCTTGIVVSGVPTGGTVQINISFN